MEGKRRSFGMTMRAYQFSDFDAVRDLYLKVWKEQRGENYDRVRMRDTYDGLPVASLAYFKENLGGFFTVWPMPLTDGRALVSGGQAMDVMTDERFRGKGVFPALAEQTAFDALKRGIKVLYGVPNEAIYETYIKRLAWAAPAKVRTFVRMLSLRKKHRLLSIADPLFSALPSGKTSPFAISMETPGDDFVDLCLAGEPRTRGVWRIAKSKRWYDFRYQENERFDYAWITLAGEGAGNSFAILGIDKSSQNGFRRANVLDVVGSTPDARIAAVSAACKYARESGADYIAMTTTSRKKVSWMRRNSFFPVKSSPLIVKTLDPSAFSANPYGEDSWDLFGGDFDFA